MGQVGLDAWHWSPPQFTRVFSKSASELLCSHRRLEHARPTATRDRKSFDGINFRQLECCARKAYGLLIFWRPRRLCLEKETLSQMLDGISEAREEFKDYLGMSARGLKA